MIYTGYYTSILSTYNFKDLRGGQGGTGDEQTLIVWGMPNADMSNVISQLSEITPTCHIADQYFLFVLFIFTV
jgi:hypothetical protein